MMTQNLFVLLAVLAYTSLLTAILYRLTGRALWATERLSRDLSAIVSELLAVRASETSHDPMLGARVLAHSTAHNRPISAPRSEEVQPKRSREPREQGEPHRMTPINL